MLHCDVPVLLVVPNLDALNEDVQGDVFEHLTYDEVTAENDVDDSLDDLPIVHHDVLPDVVNDVWLNLSKLIC